MRVLLVDDEPDVRRVAALSLQRIGGMDVVEADSSDAALRVARESRPDVILLDVMMAGRDGPATLAALREDPTTASIPVVFLTARARESELVRLRSLGAAGVLTKPFDPIELPDQVRRLVGA